jgi:hypothetical protein
MKKDVIHVRIKGQQDLKQQTVKVALIKSSHRRKYKTIKFCNIKWETFKLIKSTKSHNFIKIHRQIRMIFHNSTLHHKLISMSRKAHKISNFILFTIIIFLVFN